MIIIKQLRFFVLILTVFIGCTTAKINSTNVETKKKLSISEKLKSNNDLPIDERIALYHQLKKEQVNVYNFEIESELNTYAYELLYANLPEEAIELFKLNLQQFPNSADAYSSLADGYSNLSYKYQELAKENQEQANEIWSVLEMDETWGTEIFHFPIRFAKTIDYFGIEDARFPKGWSDTTSDYFWTYLFGWNIDSTVEITTSELEKNMTLYFDGLMTSRNRIEHFDPKITVAKFEKTAGNTFRGTVQIYDAFTTKKTLLLNVSVDCHYCESKKATQILFKFSPKGFNHEVWEVMKMAKFQDDICEF